MPKPLAKALHTVTVLVNLGRHEMFQRPDCGPRFAVMIALETLGYEPGCADKDGCIAKAMKILEAEAADRAAAEIIAKEQAAERRMAGGL